MRCLFMAHGYIPHTAAGAETTAHDLLRAVAAAGHTVDVLLSENRGATEPYGLDGVTVHPHVETGDPFRWFGTERQPDVVISQLQNTNRAAVLAGMHGVPHVHILHNDMMHTRHMIRVGPSDLVVYNARWVRESVESWLLFVADQNPPPGITVHPPIRADDYRLDKPSGQYVTQVNLFTGTKGPELFYELARRMPEQKFLGVIGAYGDQLIMELPNVDLVGPYAPQQMRAKVYARTRVLLMPSTYESYGRCAIEACCAGIPVIASTAPGLVESLGSSGTCIDRADVDGWEAELRKVLTPRGWAAAGKRSKAIAAGLTADKDLVDFVTALETVTVRPRVVA